MLRRFAVFLLYWSSNDLWLTGAFSASSLAAHRRQHQQSRQSGSPPLYAFTLRDADLMEELVGGERYEMVPLPDSMMDTTLFVGNLNEFVKDGDLSDFFQTASVLQSVPACVARRPNFDSLRYGFVSFPNMAEKEAAIMRFHGCTFMGTTLRVEEIRDHPKKGRVRVPEKIVSYVSGSIKKTRDGRANTMRSIARIDAADKKKKAKQKAATNKRKQQAKKKKRALRPLSEPDQAEFDRALRRGYVTLSSTGYRNGRKSSALACAHREWCDEHEKPQIVLCKASGGRPRDCIIVDLSPLRVLEDDFLLHHKIDILNAATTAGMELCSTEDEDDDSIICSATEDGMFECVITVSNNDDASKHISKLPVQSLGVFEGERSQAKTMSKLLATLWDIPVMLEETDFTKNKKHNTNNNGRPDRHNKRKANHRRRERRQKNNDWSSYL